MNTAPLAWIRPDWPAPGRVRALITTRREASRPDRMECRRQGLGGMNLGFGSGDLPRRGE